MNTRVGLITSALILVLAPSVGAQQPVEVTYDHYGQCRNVVPRPDGCTVSRSVQLGPGGTLRVWIKHTSATLFSVGVRGYTVLTTVGVAPAAGAGTGASREPGDSVVLVLTHNTRYGGYVVTVAPAGDPQRHATDTTIPGPAVLVITVEAPESDHLFSGGFAFSNVTSEVFVAKQVAAGQYKVTTDASRRDEATAAFATYADVRLPRIRWLWPGIGAGVDTHGRPQFYLGLAVQLARSAFFNFGGVIGQVDVLPGGIAQGDTIADPALLTDLPHRTELGLYVGISFTFLGGGKEALAKPFAGAASN